MSMGKPASLSTKLGAIGALLLLMALASIGLTLWVTWQLEGGAAAVNDAHTAARPATNFLGICGSLRTGDGSNA